MSLISNAASHGEQFLAQMPDMIHHSAPPSAVRQRRLRVAVDLVEGGHHPAFGHECSHTYPDVASGSVTPGDERTERFRALDLQLATAAYCRRLDEAEYESARRPAALLDVEILIAPTARAARLALRELELATPSSPTTLRYVGTPAGLACLAADIRAAGVADGVTLLPLANAGTVELLAEVTVPALHRAGLVGSDAASSLVAAMDGIAAA
ncbi:hypothetical protein ACH47B_17830 [Rhodococcus sp. NPDC019627]|uniref:hypothetical protein n=1 Tax=unclassified Rhodococcus (in: high G+C Gram-positive bacteria) TaxID=192944 RepID=UPI0033EB4D1C